MQIQVTRRYDITGSSSQALKNMTKGEAKAEEHEQENIEIQAGKTITQM